jgi:hypothetical protein
MRPPYGILPPEHMMQAAYRPEPDARLLIIWRRLLRKALKGSGVRLRAHHAPDEDLPAWPAPCDD